MGVFSWLSRSKPTDYETVLAELASEIHEAKLYLSEIRLRQRRFSLIINAYGFGLWAVWTGLWWLARIPWSLVGVGHDNGRIIGGAGVIIAPLFIWMLNRLLSIIFSRIRTSEEANLRQLLSKQRTAVEEIKKATNYDATRKLIEEYDESPRHGPMPGQGPSTPQLQQRSQPSTPVRNTPGTPSPQGQGPQGPIVHPATPRAPGHLVGAGGTPAQAQTPGTPLQLPPGMTGEQAAVLQMQVQASQPILPTPEKKWYDRLADTILGDDPSQAIQSKYALVCSECFRHNGLVGSKYEWERMQWICPRCNHLNPAPLSRMRAEAASAVIEDDSGPETPSKPPKPQPISPAPPHLRASPRPRRQLGERATPRSSRLGQEVFSASSDDAEEPGIDEQDEERMEIDK